MPWEMQMHFENPQGNGNLSKSHEGEVEKGKKEKSNFKHTGRQDENKEIKKKGKRPG